MMMFLAFVTVGVFEKTPELISNSSHLHSGSNFVVEFEVFLVFTVPGKELLHAVLWVKIRYQVFLGDRIDPANEVENIIDICTVRLHQARGFYFLCGSILPVVIVLHLLLCFYKYAFSWMGVGGLWET